MNQLQRVAAAGGVVIGLLAAGGCHASPVASPTPSVTSATPMTPTPTPSKTYGPNATAALTTVRAYYEWINTYKKDPSFPNFGELNRLATGEALSAGAAAVNTLALEGQRQVGDVTVVDLVPDGESPSLINIAACLDSSNATRFDKQGQVVPRPAGVPARLAYALKVESQSGAWLVTSARGGSTSC